jgi:uroporphyrinogen-III synthase
MLQELIAIAVEFMACDACLVYLPDHETGDIVLRASQLPHDAEIGAVRLNLGEGVAGWVAQHRSAVALSNNAFADPRFKHFTTLIEDTYEALVSVPLVRGGEVIGVLNVHHREPHDYSPDEISVLCFLGEQMGGAIAYSMLAEHNQKLRKEASLVRQQLAERKTVERAKGVLQQRFGLSEEEAYQRLREESRRQRKPIREVAEAVLMVEGLGQERSKKEGSDKLRELADDTAAGETALHNNLRPKSGTRYVREYEGKLHEVTVLDSGYEYEGQTYRSLTEIAKTITGTKWSGPAFFGQRRSKKETA